MALPYKGARERGGESGGVGGKGQRDGKREIKKEKNKQREFFPHSLHTVFLA